MLAGAVVTFLIGVGYHLLSPAERIYDFNEKRDTAFILDLFEKDLYWLVAEGSDFSPEYMLKHRASSKKSEHVGNEIIKVMYKGNTPVGFITYHKKKFYEGAIHFIDVAKEFRSKGYGLILLSYGVKDLIARGVAKIGLVTRTNNYSAQAIYKKAGFTESWRTDGFVYFEYVVDSNA